MPHLHPPLLLMQGEGCGRASAVVAPCHVWNLTGVETRYPAIEGGTTLWSVNNYGKGVSSQPAIFYRRRRD
jgi:hypothetical protein